MVDLLVAPGQVSEGMVQAAVGAHRGDGGIDDRERGAAGAQDGDEVGGALFSRTVDAVAGSPVSDLSRVFGNHDRHVISVVLPNLFELAHRETLVARPLSVLTPRLRRDVIHRAVVGRVRENVAASGAEAEVRLHHVPAPSGAA